jgi:Family of unknown function (DUF5681)
MGKSKVGYGNPPKHTQFRPGQSGNPKGRSKDVRNFITDVKQTLMMPIRITSGGRARKVTTQKGALILLREKALKGDNRALDQLLNLSVRFNNEQLELKTNQDLSSEDRAILDAFRAEVMMSSPTCIPGLSPPMRIGGQIKRRRIKTNE